MNIRQRIESGELKVANDSPYNPVENLHKPDEVAYKAKLSKSDSDIPYEKESDLQREAESYLRKLMDCGRIIDYFHMRKAKGNKKGLPDLLVFISFNKILYIELKRSCKEKLRPDQKKFIDRAASLYTEVFVCWTMEDVISKIKPFLI